MKSSMHSGHHLKQSTGNFITQVKLICQRQYIGTKMQTSEKHRQSEIEKKLQIFNLSTVLDSLNRAISVMTCKLPMKLKTINILSIVICCLNELRVMRTQPCTLCIRQYNRRQASQYQNGEKQLHLQRHQFQLQTHTRSIMIDKHKNANHRCKTSQHQTANF